MPRNTVKPFDLKAALNGKPVMRVDGTPVNDIAYFHSLNTTLKVAGVVNGDLFFWDDNGKSNPRFVLNGDLVMATDTVYYNLFDDGPRPTVYATYHLAKEAAERDADIGDGEFIEVRSFTREVK